MMQAVHTDLKGYFELAIGGNAGSNADFSAADDVSIGPNGAVNRLPPGFGGPEGDSLTGCELRVSVPGYRPLTYTITELPDLGRLDVGTLALQPLGRLDAGAVSVTSLLVPNNARKEFDAGEKDVRNNHSKTAVQHLEKAVASYDKYAVAWNELGKVYASNKENDKAEHAFQKSIDADPKYLAPYMNLANLELNLEKNDDAAAMAEKAVELEPSNVYANLMEAMANFNRSRLEDAEKSARAVERVAHKNVPQVHALMSDIYLRLMDYPNAAMEMRAYLREAPLGQFASDMKANLAKIDPNNTSAAADAATKVP
jgi:tetratricopeptide (TPR) repeat protein